MAIVYPKRFLAVIGRRLWKRILLGVAVIGLGAGMFHIIGLVEFGFVARPIIGDSSIIEDSAENGRADKVVAVTDASGGWKDPDKTDIRLRPAHHWLWTPLVAAESFGVHVELKWRKDDVLDVTLAFGCLVHITRPVEKVGSIRIAYHVTANDKTLASGCGG
jgi:hypothetical protein